MAEEDKEKGSRWNPLNWGRHLKDDSTHFNDTHKPVRSVATGIGSQFSQAVSNAATSVTTYIVPDKAAVSVAGEAGLGIANMSYDSSRVINTLEKEGHGSRQELRGKFNYYEKEFAEGMVNTPSLKNLGKKLVGRDGPEFECLQPFKEYIYNGGNQKEFEALKAVGKDAPPTIQDYTEFKKLTADPEINKHSKQYTPAQAIKDGGDLGMYNTYLKANDLKQYETDLATIRAENKKIEEEIKREEAKERKSGKSADMGDLNAEPAMLAAVSKLGGQLVSSGTQSREDNTALGCPEGCRNHINGNDPTSRDGTSLV